MHSETQTGAFIALSRCLYILEGVITSCNSTSGEIDSHDYTAAAEEPNHHFVLRWRSRRREEAGMPKPVPYNMVSMTSLDECMYLLCLPPVLGFGA